MKKSRLRSIALSLLALGLVIPPLTAQTATSAQSTPPPATPSVPLAPTPKPVMRPDVNRLLRLTPEEMKILGQARMQLQKDPDIMALDAQIRELIQKRTKLSEEKLQKINPEAAAILQKMIDRQKEMMAARNAQMEARQAKVQAQPEAPQKPATPPASPAAPAPAPAP